MFVLFIYHLNLNRSWMNSWVLFPSCDIVIYWKARSCCISLGSKRTNHLPNLLIPLLTSLLCILSFAQDLTRFAKVYKSSFERRRIFFEQLCSLSHGSFLGRDPSLDFVVLGKCALDDTDLMQLFFCLFFIVLDFFQTNSFWLGFEAILYFVPASFNFNHCYLLCI